MYREEVIAKALKELRDKLKASLDANKMRQRELLESVAEHELAMKTLSQLVRTKQAPSGSPAPPVAPAANPPTVHAVEAHVERPATETVVMAAEKRGFTREKLKGIAFPLIQSRFRDEPFEVSKIRELLDEMEPETSHSYEAAWNLCNDLLREGKLKQAGIKKLTKGVARLFKLKTAATNNRSLNEKIVVAEG